jgi:hypothetical protein
MIRSYPNTTKVEIYRGDKKFLNTQAAIQEDAIYFENVDIKELNIIKVSSVGIEYRIENIYTQFQGNRVVCKKARVTKVGG